MKDALSGEPVQQFAPSGLLTDVKIDRHTGRPASWVCSSDQILEEKYMAGMDLGPATCELSWPQSSSQFEIK